MFLSQKRQLARWLTCTVLQPRMHIEQLLHTGRGLEHDSLVQSEY